jgi:hypothetical protein
MDRKSPLWSNHSDVHRVLPNLPATLKLLTNISAASFPKSDLHTTALTHGRFILSLIVQEPFSAGILPYLSNARSNALASVLTT